MTRYWCETAIVEGGNGPAAAARVEILADKGRIVHITPGVEPSPEAQVLSGVVFPAAVNAHSHAFHRILRGRTHGHRGDFWVWREHMYRSASELTPESYEQLATAVFAEMVIAGFSSVAEFHYVHHQPGGEPYPERHAMEMALARAASSAGIRLTLLDTLYLAGGIGAPLGPEQTRFGDGDVHAWLKRTGQLRAEIAANFPSDMISVGAALHSVRAVPESDLAVVAQELPQDIPLHIHLSEQPSENTVCVEAYGLTPTGLLARHGLLGPRLSAVHATHLTESDISLLGEAGVTVVMCPTTEADLADGIGPAKALAQAGSPIALGTDQHAVIDPWLEMRALEHGQRLASGERGRFSPHELLRAATQGAQRSMATPTPRESLAVGAVCDLMAVSPSSVRTIGSRALQLPLSATAADLTAVIINGEMVASYGIHTGLGAPAPLLQDALSNFS